IHAFFFQAEDGIRDRNVTGVQTCALPISTKTTFHNVKYMEVLVTETVGSKQGQRRQFSAQDFVLNCSTLLTELPINDRAAAAAADRKSTRLNSSHVSISYAVFCSKKKNQK